MRTLVLVGLLFLSVVPASAQVVSLTSPEALSVPTATKLDIRSLNIDVGHKTITCVYRFITAGDMPIPMQGSNQVDRLWTCQDIPSFNVATCIGVGAPEACCTGAGTGSGCYAGSTCFSETYGDTIRQANVDAVIGKVLRRKIWNKMKSNVLTGTNDAVLD